MVAVDHAPVVAEKPYLYAEDGRLLLAIPPVRRGAHGAERRARGSSGDGGDSSGGDGGYCYGYLCGGGGGERGGGAAAALRVAALDGGRVFVATPDDSAGAINAQLAYANRRPRASGWRISAVQSAALLTRARPMVGTGREGTCSSRPACTRCPPRSWCRTRGRCD